MTPTHERSLEERLRQAGIRHYDELIHDQDRRIGNCNCEMPPTPPEPMMPVLHFTGLVVHRTHPFAPSQLEPRYTTARHHPRTSVRG